MLFLRSSRSDVAERCGNTGRLARGFKQAGRLHGLGWRRFFCLASVSRLLEHPGIALTAMTGRPSVFPLYQDKADAASAKINKFLINAGLRPTARHTVYSFRHTFKDRIENAGASDRMQADLMGHEFRRPTYGSGAEIKRRQDFLATISLKHHALCKKSKRCTSTLSPVTLLSCQGPASCFLPTLISLARRKPLLWQPPGWRRGSLRKR